MASVSNVTSRFDQSIPADAIFKLSHISHATRVHLKNVYASLTLCTIMAAVGSCVCVVASFSPIVLAGLAVLSIVGLPVSVIWLGVTTHSPETEKKRFSILLGFAFFSGLALGPALHLAISVDPSIAVLAVAATAVLFVSFTLSALYVERRIYMLLGGVAPTLVIMLTLTMIDLVSDMDTYLGVLMYCAFVTIDTQLIVEKAENGDKDYIWHCVGLFLDIAEMFRKITTILALKNKNKNKHKDDIEKCIRGHDEL
ncbi:probable Bax inhibitor 1 [Pelmatolapia mariae]|uniref:probable Bax inhibitor 1 n=1 Tax=Pelmatolapia mariae TaxID=158779 RepID=UPI002FE6402A